MAGPTLVERERIVQVRLAHVQVRGERGEFDVGQHAALLGAVAQGPVELLHGDLQGAHLRRVGDAEKLLADVLRLCTVPLPCVE